LEVQPKNGVQLKQTMPKFYATLWESLSIESREEVSQHADFEHADLNQDPNVLWTIIRETHLTAIHGVGLGALELVKMKNKFVCPISTEAWRICRRVQKRI
jgi:hypothetical protein